MPVYDAARNRRPFAAYRFLAASLAFAAVGALAAAGPTEACMECHRGWSELTEWGGSVHASAGVKCVGCHGGDAAAVSMDAVRARGGFVGKFRRRDIPAMCAKCHGDAALMKQYRLPYNQYDEYKTSVHGRALAAGDEDVAVCTDCHGVHLILPAADANSTVNKLNVAATCNRCHGDANLMARYKIPAAIYEKYAASYHGKLVLKERVAGAPSCPDCHGNHGAAPPGVTEVVNTCGSCHVNQRRYYAESPHAVAEGGREACVTCHGNHAIVQPDDALYTGSQNGACGSCHPADTTAYKTAELIAGAFGGAKDAVHKTDAKIKSAAGRAIPTEVWEQKLSEAQAKITEAYPVAHSLSLDKVNPLLKEAVSGARRVDYDVDAARRERERRKQVLAFVLALMTFNVAVLFWKRHALFKELPD